MYHCIETVFLGRFGVVPPASGTGYLPAVLTGPDLNGYANQLISAGFNLPLYVGFLSIGLVGASQIIRRLRLRGEQASHKGVAVVFTPE